MTKDRDMPAMPIDRDAGHDIDHYKGPEIGGYPTGTGLTKLQYAAIHLSAGLLASGRCVHVQAVEEGIRLANILLTDLEDER